MNSAILQAGSPPAQTGQQDVIVMKQVYKTYKTPAGEFTALKGLDATFRQGEFVSVIGKSGSGKSTLINMITGIDHPTAGTVQVCGSYLHKLKEGQTAEWRGRNLGIVFQFFQLLPMLTVLENILLPMDFCNTYPPAEREPRAWDLLRLLGLEDLADKMPAELSGGQQQTAAIARALSNDPPIIVADEPTGNLDTHTADAVFQIFCDLTRQGKTIIMVTHDKSMAELTTRSLLIFDGELIHETIASTFSGLAHRQMLWLTKQMHPVALGAGEPHEILPGDSNFVLVSAGEVELILKNGLETKTVRLRSGDWVSRAEEGLLASGSLCFQAVPGQSAQILTLENSAYSELLAMGDPFQFASQKAAIRHSDLLKWLRGQGGDDAPSLA